MADYQKPLLTTQQAAKALGKQLRLYRTDFLNNTQSEMVDLLSRHGLTISIATLRRMESGEERTTLHNWLVVWQATGMINDVIEAAEPADALFAKAMNDAMDESLENYSNDYAL